MLLAEHLADSGETIDPARAVGMALLHETGEIFIGDLVPGAARALGSGVKEAAELAHGGSFLDGLAPRAGALFREYMAGQSAEAILVRDCDRLALLLKTALYRRAGYRGVAALLSPDKYSFRTAICASLAGRTFRALAAEGLAADAEEPPWEGPPDK
jgi:5'-deoxynucleotidase YfbR-like HD superfamily hydrolase